jgi:hypothetical protein
MVDVSFGSAVGQFFKDADPPQRFEKPSYIGYAVVFP